MPPTPVKQHPRPTPASPPPPSGGLGIKLLAYGRGKTGKTRLIATFPKPLLLIGTEDGTKSIATSCREKRKLQSCGSSIYELLLRDKSTGIDFIRLSRATELDEVSEIAKSYQSIGLDTAGGLQDLILAGVLGLDDTPVQKSWGMTDRQTWGIVGAQFKERCRKLLDLADRQGTNIVVVAHERNFNDEGSSDVLSPVVGAALTPSAATWLNGACDYICQTFLRAQVVKSKTKVGNADVETAQKTGKVEYCLRIGPHEVYMTGFRQAPGGQPLPDAIVDPSFDKISKIIQGG